MQQVAMRYPCGPPDDHSFGPGRLSNKVRRRGSDPIRGQQQLHFFDGLASPKQPLRIVVSLVLPFTPLWLPRKHGCVKDQGGSRCTQGRCLREPVAVASSSPSRYRPSLSPPPASAYGRSGDLWPDPQADNTLHGGQGFVEHNTCPHQAAHRLQSCCFSIAAVKPSRAHFSPRRKYLLQGGRFT